MLQGQLANKPHFNNATIAGVAFHVGAENTNPGPMIARKHFTNSATSSSLSAVFIKLIHLTH